MGADDDAGATPSTCPYKYVTLDKWLHDTGVHIAVIQETRRPDKGPFTTAHYNIYPTPAVSGHGGMALLTHRTDVTATYVHSSDNTAIHATVQALDAIFYIIGGHAPHTSTTPQRRHQWWNALL